MYTIIYLNLSFIYIGASLYSNSFLSFFHTFLTFQRKMKEKIGWLFQTLLKGLQIYVYSRNCLYLGYTIHIWIFKDLILVKRKKRTTIFFVCSHWGYFCCLKWEMSRKMDIEEEWEKCPFVELLPQLWIFNL